MLLLVVDVNSIYVYARLHDVVQVRWWIRTDVSATLHQSPTEECFAFTVEIFMLPICQHFH